MGGTRALRADHVQECQISVGAIDAERAYRAAVPAVEIGNLIDRVQILTIRMDCDPGRGRNRRGDLDLCQGSRRHIEVKEVNALTVWGVGADICQNRTCGPT